MKELKVTSGKQWRKMREDGVIVELPSGFVAKLRPVQMESLLESDNVPDILGPMVASMINENGQVSLNKPEELVNSANKLIEFYRVMLKEIFLEPCIVDEPKEDNEIDFYDVESVDRDFAITWAQSPMYRLKLFRAEQEALMEFTRNGENVQPEAE